MSFVETRRRRAKVVFDKWLKSNPSASEEEKFNKWMSMIPDGIASDFIEIYAKTKEENKMADEAIHEALSNFAEEDLWKEIYFRTLRMMAADRGIILTDTELRNMAESAHDSNEDEEADLFRRCSDMFEDEDGPEIEDDQGFSPEAIKYLEENL